MMNREETRARATDFVERITRACGWRVTFSHREGLRPFVEESRSWAPELGVAVVLELFRVAGEVADEEDDEGDRRFWSIVAYGFRAGHALAVAEFAAALLRRKLPFTVDDVTQMLRDTVRLEVVSLHGMRHIPPLVRLLERRWGELGQSAAIREQLALLRTNARKMGNAPEVKLAMRIERLLGPDFEFPVDPGEAWSDRARSDLEAMDEESHERWLALLVHCQRATSSRPSAKWLRSAQEVVEAIGQGEINRRLLVWLPLVDRHRTAPVPEREWREWPFSPEQIKERHADILRGLCWVVSLAESAEMARALGALAISCYRRVPRIGPRVVKVGNAAVYALGAMPGPDSLAQLARLRVKIKFGTAQKMLGKALDAAADRERLPRDEIEEMAVPAYGLIEVGRCEEMLGEYRAVIEVAGTTGAAAAALTWINAKGKVVKSTPAAVKRDHADDLKDMRATLKDLRQMLASQRDRLDSLFLQCKEWDYDVWRERYLDHPLVGTIARRLIWLFDDDSLLTAAAWLRDDPAERAHRPGRLVRVDGSTYTPASSARVTLWHPIDSKAAPGIPTVREDVLPWRHFLEAHQVQQPFKQAHREVYLLTEVERQTGVYSNRFAAHILRQHQFSALAAQRAWKHQLRLAVDADYSPPQRILEPWGLRAEFWVETIGSDELADFITHSSAYRFLTTDQVRFYRIDAAEHRSHASGGSYLASGDVTETADAPVSLDSVPPLVLSEIMRDVDLFVGAASVGNDPEWQDGGPEGLFRDYWQSYSFGQLSTTAQTRREILSRLLPRLSIASACSLSDRHLVVLGTRATYRIHLGSTNVLMEPGGQYLCIVSDVPKAIGSCGRRTSCRSRVTWPCRSF